MKRKIKVVDKVSNKTEEHEYNVRNLDHFSVQLNTKAHVFQDKRKKAPRHKKKVFEDD